MKTIDVTPTWEDILPLLLAMYERKNRTAFILSQFQSMAQAADKWNAHATTTQTKEN